MFTHLLFPLRNLMYNESQRETNFSALSSTMAILPQQLRLVFFRDGSSSRKKKIMMLFYTMRRGRSTRILTLSSFSERGLGCYNSICCVDNFVCLCLNTDFGTEAVPCPFIQCTYNKVEFSYFNCLKTTKFNVTCKFIIKVI